MIHFFIPDIFIAPL